MATRRPNDGRAGRAATPARRAKPEPRPVTAPRSDGLRPLTRKDYPKFKKLLLDERARLMQELETMEKHTADMEEAPLVEMTGDEDFADSATDTFDRERIYALESTVQGMLRMVEDALRKVEQGTYGICETCGQPINPERLEAIPYARLCITCKEREERSRNGR